MVSSSRPNLFGVLFLSATIGLSLVANAAQQGQNGNGGRRRPSGDRIKMQEAPLPTLVKTCSFPLYVASPRDFNLMVSESVMLPKGFVAPNSAPQQLVILTYGFKKGGVVRVYESSPTAIKDAAKFVEKVVANNSVRDPRKQVLKFAKANGVVLGVRSVNEAAVDAMVPALIPAK
jgi:hypothetical protein